MDILLQCIVVWVAVAVITAIGWSIILYVSKKFHDDDKGEF